MFSLLFGLWKYLFAKAEYHVLILGIDKAGKTTLLEKVKAIYSDLEALPPERIVPTVGLNIGRVDAHKCKLIFWDLGGQLGLRSIWEKYYEEAHAVLYVVDAACQSRFEDVKNALARVMQHVELDGAPILVLANKQDLPGAISAEDMSRTLDMIDVNDRPCLVKAACAYDGSGVRDGVLWLVEAMKKSQRSEKLKQRAESAIQF
ncbi:GTP-binding ADP-ribosylation factor-like protein [Klebsormidium nitens]|uniref:GTP-binding ADP-ribosylation factor-like protein n=1 Tax=Klebsormidium nitens TaxID=105231 RepID=A0A1Y1HL25_KLENI|nr:GTP-binding ADP-ribosylation factor-like protein [Klebsormidium nitens]|eukprot:GAQ77681.1 GTP-binding ADP-ribosylation factor-like protein [Klebsormidium nitens]